MKGGADTGFRHVEPEKYVSRLFKFSSGKSGGLKSVTMVQVNSLLLFLDECDCVVLDELRVVSNNL